MHDTTGSAHEVSLRWAKWKRSFQYYVEGEGLTDQKKIRSKMLHLAGLEVQDIFETLTESVVPDGEDDPGVCAKALQRVDGYFQYRPNTKFERHSFRQLTQRSSETVNQFVDRLRQQAKFCNFTNKAEHIRNQLVRR